MKSAPKSRYVKHVLVIAGSWSTRALIGAQLKEEGFEVTGSDTFESAVSQLEQSKIKPRLLVVESTEIAIDQKAISLLDEMCHGAPLILICGAWDCPSQLRWTGAMHELRKPITIGQIVEKVKELFPI
jgi:DNA-binding NtrC family response regulator